MQAVPLVVSTIVLKETYRLTVGSFDHTWSPREYILRRRRRTRPAVRLLKCPLYITRTWWVILEVTLAAKTHFNSTDWYHKEYFELVKQVVSTVRKSQIHHSRLY